MSSVLNMVSEQTFEVQTNKIASAISNAGGGTVDTEMSDTSTNAVQNKVIKEYVDAQSGGGATVITLIPNQSGSGFTSETTYKEAYDASKKGAVIFTTAQGENEVYGFLLSALKIGDNYTLDFRLGGSVSLTGSANDFISQNNA